jgi:tetratricopeptide (TPR) repeat protein
MSGSELIGDRVLRTLKELAERATPGPWESEDCRAATREKSRYQNGAFQVFSKDCEYHAIADCSCNHTCRDDEQCEDNAAFIAACDPQTILSLLSQVSANSANGNYKQALDKCVEALEIFIPPKDGALEEALWGDAPDDAPMTIQLSLGQFRKARAALSAAREAGGGK